MSWFLGAAPALRSLLVPGTPSINQVILNELRAAALKIGRQIESFAAGSPDSMGSRSQIEAVGILLHIDERLKHAEKHSRKQQGDYDVCICDRRCI
jgi:hypothetical protein